MHIKTKWKMCFKTTKCDKLQVSTVLWQNSQLKHFLGGVCHALPGRKMLSLNGYQCSDSLEMDRMPLSFMSFPFFIFLFVVLFVLQLLTVKLRSIRVKLDWCWKPGHFQNLLISNIFKKLDHICCFLISLLLSVKQYIPHVNLTSES